MNCQTSHAVEVNNCYVVGRPEVDITEVYPIMGNTLRSRCFSWSQSLSVYVGFTRRHLHQRVEEHKNSSSSIGKHFRDKHSLAPKDLTKNFSVLMKCTNKFDCLVYEMLFIRELRPTLNVQSDSIRAKVFN